MAKVGVMALWSAAVARLCPESRSAFARFLDQLRVGVPVSASTDRAEVQRPELAVVEFDVRVPPAVVQRLKVDRFDVGGHEVVESLIVRWLIPADARIFALCAPLSPRPFPMVVRGLFGALRGRWGTGMMP